MKPTDPQTRPDDADSTSTDTSTNASANPEDKARQTAEQNAQARLVLIQLQWLITILLVAAIVWLGNNQRKLAVAVDTRLKVTEELNVRLNDMDDRLYALSPAPKAATDTTTAQSDLQLFTIRMEAAQRLYDQGNYDAALEMLKTLMWQMNNKHIAIAAPLKATLVGSLQSDIEHITAIMGQPDAWQLHIIKMQDIRQYLHSLDAPHAGTMTRTELELQNAVMMLSLAIGTGSLRERDTMTGYLKETLTHLETLKKLSPASSNPPNAQAPSEPPENDKIINSLDDAIFAVNELLANSPKSRLLTSMRILTQEHQSPMREAAPQQ